MEKKNVEAIDNRLDNIKEPTAKDLDDEELEMFAEDLDALGEEAPLLDIDFEDGNEEAMKIEDIEKGIERSSLARRGENCGHAAL